jgi:hypothetical protein
MSKKAILIGINYSNDTNAELFGCINDVVSMKNVLIDAYGYKNENIIVLRDDSDDYDAYNSQYKKPTREIILNTLKEVALESDDFSELWIHYSGHGTYLFDIEGDESDQYDEAIVPCDFRQNGMIKDDELRNILDIVNCKTFITMDCCHAGSSWDMQYKFPIYNNRIYRDIENRRSIKNKSIYMLAGSRDYQTAADHYNFEKKQPMGAFTMCLINSMRELNHNYSLLKLYVFVHKKLEESNYNQKCILSCSNNLPYVNISRSNGLERNLSIKRSTSTRTNTKRSRSMSLDDNKLNMGKLRFT